MALLCNLLLVLISTSPLTQGRQLSVSQSEEAPIGDDSASQSEDAFLGDDFDSNTDSQSEDSLPNTLRASRNADDVDWNNVIDNVLEEFRKKTDREIDLPALHKTYSIPLLKHILPKKLALQLDGKNGHLSSIHSLHRLGDVSVSGTTLTAIFKFGSLRLSYGDFRAAVVNVGPHGRLDATVADNLVRVRARVTQSGGECRLVYEDVDMVEVQMVNLKLTGLGPLNRFYSFMGTKIIKLLKDCISNSLERLFESKLSTMFENYPFSCAQ